MAENKKTTDLDDFLGDAALPPAPAPAPAAPPAPVVPAPPSAIPDSFQEVEGAATESMGAFLDAVGADLSAPPEEDEEEEPLHDPMASMGATRDPEDHRSFLSSMGVPVTPAPVQRSQSPTMADSARAMVQTVQRNWVPSLLMAIVITVIVFFLTGVFSI